MGTFGKSLADILSECTSLRITTTFKLEKFDGEYEPGKEPVETILGGDDLPQIVIQRRQKGDSDGA